MKRALIALILTIGFGSTCTAQTVSPVISEYGKKVYGTYTIRNDSLQPVSLVIEAYQATYDSKGQHLQPVDPSLNLQLSETSVRLSPRETHQITFKAKPISFPVSLVFLNGMTMGHTQGDKDHPSLAVRLILPHVAYICSAAKDCRKNTLTAAGLANRLATP
jgi:hypothetical protein